MSPGVGPPGASPQGRGRPLHRASAARQAEGVWRAGTGTLLEFGVLVCCMLLPTENRATSHFQTDDAAAQDQHAFIQAAATQLIQDRRFLTCA